MVNGLSSSSKLFLVISTAVCTSFISTVDAVIDVARESDTWSIEVSDGLRKSIQNTSASSTGTDNMMSIVLTGDIPIDVSEA